MSGKFSGAALLALSVALSACVKPDAAEPPPAILPMLPPPVLSAPRSAESLALADYFASVVSFQTAQGNLRRDGGGRDTPFDARRVTNAFMNIVFYNEFDTTGKTAQQQKTSTNLARWTQNLRVNVEFGQSMPPAAKATDQTEITNFLARLSRLTGRSIATSDATSANVLVLVVTEDERRALLPRIENFAGKLDTATLATIRDPAKSTYCLALAVDPDNDHVIDKGVVIIRAEGPDMLRLSCIHEELAQMMGLVNDDPAARPSIFNDDEEFATLTRMDEYLLRILYDPRLRPGMNEEQARAIVDTIAEGMLASARGS